MAVKWLEELRANLGDAFTIENRSIVGAENLATARMLAALHSTGERLVNNATPLHAYDTLLAWARRLGVPVRASDSADTIRRACLAKYRAQGGNSQTATQEVVTTLLSEAFTGITYYYPQSFEADDPDVKKLHVLVRVQQPAGMTEDAFLYLLSVHLWGLLDLLLPAYATFDWSVDDGSGFIISGDTINGSLIGRTAL